MLANYLSVPHGETYAEKCDFAEKAGGSARFVLCNCLLGCDDMLAYLPAMPLVLRQGYRQSYRLILGKPDDGAGRSLF